jgi:hypothetical protein
MPALPIEELLGLVAIVVPVIFIFTRLMIIKPFGHLSIEMNYNPFRQWKKLLIAVVIIVLARVGLIFGITIN